MVSIFRITHIQNPADEKQVIHHLSSTVASDAKVIVSQRVSADLDNPTVDSFSLTIDKIAARPATTEREMLCREVQAIAAETALLEIRSVELKRRLGEMVCPYRAGQTLPHPDSPGKTIKLQGVISGNGQQWHAWGVELRKGGSETGRVVHFSGLAPQRPAEDSGKRSV